MSSSSFSSSCSLSSEQIKAKEEPSPMNTDAKSMQGLDSVVPELKGTIIVECKDGTKLTVERKYTVISVLMKTALINDPEATVYPAPCIKGNIMALIIEYMNHHQGLEPPIIEKPLRDKKMEKVCQDKWDADFIDRVGMSKPVLRRLILAANYLDMRVLLHLGGAKVASMIKGLTPEKVKEVMDPKSWADGEEDPAEKDPSLGKDPKSDIASLYLSSSSAPASSASSSSMALSSAPPTSSSSVVISSASSSASST